MLCLPDARLLAKGILVDTVLIYSVIEGSTSTLQSINILKEICGVTQKYFYWLHIEDGFDIILYQEERFIQ